MEEFTAEAIQIKNISSDRSVGLFDYDFGHVLLVYTSKWRI